MARCSAAAPAPQRLVDHDECNEHQERQNQPGCAGPVHPVDEKRQHQPRREDDQARIGDVMFEPVPALASGQSLVVPALVLAPETILRVS